MNKNNSNNNLISVGKILNFHGIKGEVKIGYTKGRDELVSGLKNVFVGSFKSKSDEKRALTVSAVRFHKQHALIKFKEINTVNEAEEIKGFDIFVPKSGAEKYLEDDEYLVSDLIGLDVLDTDGALIGSVVDFAQNFGNDLLSVRDGNGKNHFVPFVKELVPSVNLKTGTIVVNDIEGLIE